jgi:hypothetical protein
MRCASTRRLLAAKAWRSETLPYVALDQLAGEEQDARYGRLIQIKGANANRA